MKEFDSSSRPEVLSIRKKRSRSNSSKRKKKLPLPLTAREQEKECAPSYYTPKQSDIIIGKALMTMKHPGNSQLKQIIESQLNKFASIPSRSIKARSKIISIVIDSAKQNGANFIKQDSETQAWSVVNKKAERLKVSQSLRNAMNRTCISSLKNNNSLAKAETEPDAATVGYGRKLYFYDEKKGETIKKARINTKINISITKSSIMFNNKRMIEYHIQSIQKLQQQNLALSLKKYTIDSNNNNSNHPDSITLDKEEESYHSFSSSSLNDCFDGDDNSTKSHALPALSTKCKKKK